MNFIQALAFSMHHLSAQGGTRTADSLSTQPALLATALILTSETLIPLPEHYSWEVRAYRRFQLQFSLTFETQLSLFSTNSARLRYVVNASRSKAGEWVNSLWDVKEASPAFFFKSFLWKCRGFRTSPQTSEFKVRLHINSSLL